MNKYYDEENSKLDKILLIARRVFIILFIGLILWIVFFKLIGIGKDKGINIKGDTKNISGDILDDESNGANSMSDILNNTSKGGKDLGKNYSVKDSKIYYKGKLVAFANAQNFFVLNDDKEHIVTGTIINSTNLLKVFHSYETRKWMMNNIDRIIKEQINSTNELKSASENSMYNMKSDYNQLSKLTRNDRYNMTNQQRAKFAIMYLYVKILKSTPGIVYMETALDELRYFLEHFDKNDLEKEVSNGDLNKITGDIALDDYCIYLDGELYACFLDKLFVK